MPSFILMPSDCSRLLAVVFQPGSSVKMDWRGVETETLPFALSHHFWLFDKKIAYRQREQSSGRKSDASSSVALLWGQKNDHIDITVSAQLL